MLLGLDVFDQECHVASHVINELQALLSNSSMPLEKEFGHLYLCWGAKKVLYTEPELFRLHRQFHYPLSGSLYEVIKHERPSQVDKPTPKTTLRHHLVM